ncbi:hypothetical protein [Nitrosomonas sp.]|uniref:hypothetical protein n=1 Tax=Nitrosomonas sp. TaxID=42353 RepID=UPI0028496D23|nr:hypothetical protein [Nitrosomonas sp.]MDR4513160.1 hypothetical protein [Nitrosomonas sp.]
MNELVQGISVPAIEEITGKDIFKNNLLYIPEWKRGLSPYEIRSLFWECQLNRCLKSENRLLKQEIDKLEIKAAFYKKQLVLESRFGWILENCFL